MISIIYFYSLNEHVFLGKANIINHLKSCIFKEKYKIIFSFYINMRQKRQVNKYNVLPYSFRDWY
jgi:hypothetical protein